MTNNISLPVISVVFPSSHANKSLDCVKEVTFPSLWRYKNPKKNTFNKKNNLKNHFFLLFYAFELTAYSLPQKKAGVDI